MKCHILFSGKNEINITNLSSAEIAQRGVKGNYCPLGPRLMLPLHKAQFSLVLLKDGNEKKNVVVTKENLHKQTI